MKKESFKSKFFGWMDQHPTASNDEISAAFPGEKPNKLRTYRAMYRKQQAGDSDGVQDTSTNESTNTSTEPKPETDKNDNRTCMNESIDTSTQKDEPHEVIETDESEALEDTCKNTSMNTSMFLDQLFDRRETLFRLLDQWEQTGTPSQLEVNLTPPYRTVSYSLMEGTLEDFVSVCQSLGVSQRKAIHVAIQEFIARYQKDRDE